MNMKSIVHLDQGVPKAEVFQEVYSDCKKDRTPSRPLMPCEAHFNNDSRNLVTGELDPEVLKRTYWSKKDRMFLPSFALVHCSEVIGDIRTGITSANLFTACFGGMNIRWKSSKGCIPEVSSIYKAGIGTRLAFLGVFLMAASLIYGAIVVHPLMLIGALVLTILGLVGVEGFCIPHGWTTVYKLEGLLPEHIVKLISQHPANYYILADARDKWDVDIVAPVNTDPILFKNVGGHLIYVTHFDLTGDEQHVMDENVILDKP